MNLCWRGQLKYFFKKKNAKTAQRNSNSENRSAESAQRNPLSGLYDVTMFIIFKKTFHASRALLTTKGRLKGILIFKKPLCQKKRQVLKNLKSMDFVSKNYDYYSVTL